MSRELKFRVWNEDENKFMPSGFIGISDGKFFDLKNGSIHFDNDDKVIEQFTGLRDRNGKDIYEGDIVKFGHEDYVYIVDGFAAMFRHPESEESSMVFDHNDAAGDDAANAQVVGNIHENGELVKNLGLQK